MDWFADWYILPAAFALDILVGDPRYLPHPVRWMGKTIEWLEPSFRRLPLNLTLSGKLYAVVLILGTWLLTFLVVSVAHRVHPLFKTTLDIILIFFCISIRSLSDAAMEVKHCLQHNQVQAAREKVALIVGRDIDQYKEEGLARATVETVAENLVDGITAPLFFAAIGGAPLAVAYKMINTLDSMVGYKNDTYHQFGKASARIDDLFNFIPARLTVPVVALAAQILSRCGKRSLRTAICEGANHASPNAGYPEAAFAGALAVKLNGPNYYNGKLVEKPYIGIRFGRSTPDHILKACDIMILTSFLWLISLVVVQWLT
ncbi:MAG: adenosylcobinamide-phosphate synthase CbiB [Desulfobacterales bacterium]|jgi:adenosylcobinamide-phosphate synthase